MPNLRLYTDNQLILKLKHAFLCKKGMLKHACLENPSMHAFLCKKIKYVLSLWKKYFARRSRDFYAKKMHEGAKVLDFKFMDKLSFKRSHFFLIITSHHNVIDLYNEDNNSAISTFNKHSVIRSSLFISKHYHSFIRTVKPCSKRSF